MIGGKLEVTRCKNLIYCNCIGAVEINATETKLRLRIIEASRPFEVVEAEGLVFGNTDALEEHSAIVVESFRELLVGREFVIVGSRWEIGGSKFTQFKDNTDGGLGGWVTLVGLGSHIGGGLFEQFLDFRFVGCYRVDVSVRKIDCKASGK
jgi:hypothetical protein